MSEAININKGHKCMPQSGRKLSEMARQARLPRFIQFCNNPRFSQRFESGCGCFIFDCFEIFYTLLGALETSFFNNNTLCCFLLRMIQSFDLRRGFSKKRQYCRGNVSTFVHSFWRNFKNSIDQPIGRILGSEVHTINSNSGLLLRFAFG